MRKLVFIFVHVTCICQVVSTQSDVRLPPTLNRWPKEQEIVYQIGSRFTMECGAEGIPAVTYEWRKDGSEVNTSRSNVQKGSDGTITIVRATATEEGNYQCHARNQHGSVVSNVVAVRLAYVKPTAEPPTVHQSTVVEGMPFHIQAHRPRGFPEPWFEWKIAADNRAENQHSYATLQRSNRIQDADNGDLHFSHVLYPDGGINYRCTAHYSAIPRQTRTKLTVTKNPTRTITQFAPTLAFSSNAQTVAFVGKSLRLRCFFNGFPVPTISWRVPTDLLPTERHSVGDFDTTLTLDEVAASDEGNYTCTASNSQGRLMHTLQIRIEAEPTFNSTTDGPFNVNVTEEESATFNCNAVAKPQATIAWLQNGQKIDIEDPPERFAFSNDNKTLTIRNVCRDCVNGKNSSDLMVIQCNASNAHGYAFAQGYLNVLLKTSVTIRGQRQVKVDFTKKDEFVFQCIATSDPSTPPSVRWYRTNPIQPDVLVRDEQPYVTVKNEVLVVTILPNCTPECIKYIGEYRCIADNGYSREYQTVILSDQDQSPAEDNSRNKETWAVWKMILVAVAAGLVLFLIGVFLTLRRKAQYAAANRKMAEEITPNPAGVYMYGEVGYDTIGLPLDELEGGKDGAMKRESGEYDQIGYDSIDNILDEIENREYATTQTVDIDVPNKYELLHVHAPQIETAIGGSLTLEQDIKCEDIGYLMPLEEVAGDAGKDQQQMKGCESNKESNSKSLDLNRKEMVTNSISNEASRYLALVSSEMNPYLDLVSNEVNPYLKVVSSETSPYLALVSTEENSCLELVSIEVNPNLDKTPTEVTANADLNRAIDSESGSDTEREENQL